MRIKVFADPADGHMRLDIIYGGGGSSTDMEEIQSLIAAHLEKWHRKAKEYDPWGSLKIDIY